MNENKTCECCRYWIVGPTPCVHHYLRYCNNKMVKRLVRGGGVKGNNLFTASFGCRFWQAKGEQQ